MNRFSRIYEHGVVSDPQLSRRIYPDTPLLEYLAGGMTEDEILADFPDHAREDIRASLAFAAEREWCLFSLS